MFAASRQPRYLAVVVHAQQDVTALEVQQRGHLARQRIRVNVIPLEFHDGVLAAGD